MKTRKVSKFVPGLKLSEAFYHEVVSRILASSFPGISYSAGLLGSGSEVLGFDTIESTDHHWGPRLQLFLSEDDHAALANKIGKALSEQLPRKFRGYPTNFGPPDETGVQLLQDIESGPINHRIDVMTIRSFFESYLGVDPTETPTVYDWLTIPEHRLLSVTSGAVFHDGLETLNHVRQKLSYYPREVWLYLLAAQWTLISDEEAFVGRTGALGDDLGSRVIATRLVQELMKLCFLMEKKYAPYSKWLGTSFSRLKCSKNIARVLEEVLTARSWSEREKHLSRVYSLVAAMHNKLGITKPLETRVSRFYNRRYLVIHADHFAREIRKAIREPAILRISATVGSVDQFVDCTAILSQPRLYRKLRTMFER